jgi:hypothetical protein
LPARAFARLSAGNRGRVLFPHRLAERSARGAAQQHVDPLATGVDRDLLRR